MTLRPPPFLFLSLSVSVSLSLSLFYIPFCTADASQVARDSNAQAHDFHVHDAFATLAGKRAAIPLLPFPTGAAIPWSQKRLRCLFSVFYLFTPDRAAAVVLRTRISSASELMRPRRASPPRAPAQPPPGVPRPRQSAPPRPRPRACSFMGAFILLPPPSPLLYFTSLFPTLPSSLTFFGQRRIAMEANVSACAFRNLAGPDLNGAFRFVFVFFFVLFCLLPLFLRRSAKTKNETKSKIQQNETLNPKP